MKKSFSAGQHIFVEGAVNVGLIIIDEGEALVDKLVCEEGQGFGPRSVGRLGSGAVRGDICATGHAVPYAATLRAKTLVEAIYMSNGYLLDASESFRA